MNKESLHHCTTAYGIRERPANTLIFEQNLSHCPEPARVTPLERHENLDVQILQRRSMVYAAAS
jgi:hypothetical protein